MIALMEKVTILIFYKAKEDFLRSLQKLGVIHVSQDIKEGIPEELKEMTKRIQSADAFLKVAQKSLERKTAQIKETKKLAFSYVQDYEALKESLQNDKDQLEKNEREIRNLAPWGSFTRRDRKRLIQVGLHIRFFISPIKKFSECVVDEDICVQEISRDKTHVYFVVFEKNKTVQLDCDEFFYPDHDMQTLQAERENIQRLIIKKQNKIQELFSHAAEVRDYRNRQESALKFVSVSSSLAQAAEQTVYIVNGWLPVDLRLKVKAFLDEKDIYYYFSKPQPDESVPILLKNNRFSRLFEPITKLFSLPHYAELDLTAFFAPFFTLFFGFCLGDAGYGLILFMAALLARKKLKEEQRPVSSLLLILGLSTFLFGLISGNLFGIDLSKIYGIKKLVLFNSDQLFNLALVLGLIQVLFGMFIKAFNRIRQFGAMAALSTFGWIFLLCGLFGLAVSNLSIWIVYAGIALILFFNDLKANIFVRIGKGLWELYGITGIFGDLLSYIRLFALGISSSILGFVVNDIALQFREVPFIGFLLTFAILIIGHTLNMLLGALSSFVHPLRLTFVEFYKSAGFEGGGKAYNPFRQIK